MSQTEVPPPGASASPAPEPARPEGARRRWLAPAVALAVAFAVRLPLMNAGLFHHDEVQLARAVEGSYREHRLLPAVKGRYGAVLLGLALYAPSHALTGRSAERVVPFTGILGGAVLVAAMLLLATELAGDALAGALAGAFTLGSAVFLTSSSTGKEHAPQMALVALALWLLARGAARPSVAMRLAAAAVFGFALSVHEGGILLLPPFAFYAVVLGRHHRRPWRSIGLDLAALAVAAAVPVAVSIWDEVLRNLLVPGANSARFLGLLSPGLPQALRDLATGVGVATLLLAAVGAVASVRAPRTPLLALLPWPLVLLYFGNVSSYGPRYLLYALPALAALAGAGGALLVRRWVPRRASLAAAALAVAAGAPGVARAYPLLAARAVHSGPKAMALLVKERTEPGAVVLCQDDAPFLEYYAPGRTLLAHPIGDPYLLAAFVHDLRERARGGTPVYAGEYAFAYDRDGTFRHLLQNAFVMVPVGEVVNEKYYLPELQDATFRDVLRRLVPR